jgi:hypothetical protein
LEFDAATNPEAQRRLLSLPLFKGITPFIRDFRLHNRFSLRGPGLKKRCAATREMQEAFLQWVQTLLREYPHGRIINIHETNWRSVSPGFETWATTRTASFSVQIANDHNEGITAIAGVAATWMKLPLTVTGKGKTPRCLAALNLPPGIRTAISKFGRTTVDVLLRCFQLWRENLDPSGPSDLLRNTSSAHRAAVTKEVAIKWGIELVFIPPGCTNRLQPLDRRIFGVLKAHAREISRTHCHTTCGAKITRSTIARNLLRTWECIPPDIIESTWDIIFQGAWSSDDGGKPDDQGDDEEFQLRMRQEDLDDLESKTIGEQSVKTG